MSSGRVLVGGLAILAMGTLGFLAFEPQGYPSLPGQPKRSMGVVDAFYMASITLTTAGFGDMVPSTPASKIFTVIYSFLTLGFFCGPVMAVTSSWQTRLGNVNSLVGFLVVLVATIGGGALLFIQLEGWPVTDAVYFAAITATTIGYGDHAPFTSEASLIAAAIYAICSINAVGALLGVVGSAFSAVIGTSSKGKED